MANYPFTAADLEALRQWDTPTICNALEVVAPHRRGYGFTVRPMTAVDPKLPPICGLARTGTQRAAFPSGRTKEADKAMRVGWYEYVADAALPTVVCLQDLDDTPRRRRLLGRGEQRRASRASARRALSPTGRCATSTCSRRASRVSPGW